MYIKCFLKRTITVLITLSLSGCGTFSTLGKGPLQISSAKYNGSQPCKKIRRWYSGVKYDYCVLFKGDGSNWELEGYLAWDLPFSLIVDTVVLPYTIYKQATIGSLEQKYIVEHFSEKASEANNQ